MEFYSLDLNKRIACSEEEKQECLKLAEKYVRMAERARQQGLMALEDQLDTDLPYLMRLGLQLIIDGLEPRMVNQVLVTYICASEVEGVDLLKRLIIRAGTLGLQKGDHPRLLRLQLIAYLGEDFASRVFDDTAAALEEYFNRIGKELPASDDTMFFDEEIGILKDRAIQKLLRQVDTYILANALAGASGAIRIRVMRNMSPRAALNLKEELEAPEARNHDEIVEAQTIMVDNLKRLQDEGEI